MNKLQARRMNPRDDLSQLPTREPPAPVSGNAFVYILACSDGAVLGIEGLLGRGRDRNVSHLQEKRAESLPTRSKPATGSALTLPIRRANLG